MKLKKHLVVGLVFLIAACFAMTFGTMAAAKNVIKLAHDQTADPYDPVNAFALVFKSYVENGTNGAYAVEIHPASVLGKERERLELTKAGAIHVNLASVGGVSQIYSPAILLNTPFTYRDDRIVAKVLESEFVTWMFQDMEKKTGIKSINVFELGGLSCFTNNVRPIRTVADMKGIKFRAMDDSQVAMFKALGANAVPMAWSGVRYDAVKGALTCGSGCGKATGSLVELELLRTNYLQEENQWLAIRLTYPTNSCTGFCRATAVLPILFRLC